MSDRVTSALFGIFCREAVAALEERGGDAEGVALLRAMIDLSRSSAKQFVLAQQVSQRLRAGTSDAKYAMIASDLRNAAGLSPDFFLAQQAIEAFRVLLGGRVANAFQELVLQRCVDSGHFGGAVLSCAAAMLLARQDFKARRIQARQRPSAAAR